MTKTNFATNLLGKRIEERPDRTAIDVCTFKYFGLTGRSVEIDTVFVYGDAVSVQVHDDKGDMAVLYLTNFRLSCAAKGLE